MTIREMGFNKAINGEDNTISIIKDCIYSGPVQVGNKAFITNVFLEVETQVDCNPFMMLVPEGYRYPTSQELDELCREHPFFEQAIQIKSGHMFINDLGLEVWTHSFMDNRTFVTYGPLCLCQESIDEMNERNKINKRNGRRESGFIIEKCYDIRAREYKEWFDYRVPRHAIFVHDLD